MPREAIAMTRDELLAFLAVQRWAALATLDPDGTPVGDLVPIRLDGDELRFAVPRGARSHANIEHDPRIACAADEFPAYYEIRGVVAHGRATVRAASPLGPDWIEYGVPLDDTSSFDFRKIQRKY